MRLSKFIFLFLSLAGLLAFSLAVRWKADHHVPIDVSTKQIENNTARITLKNIPLMVEVVRDKRLQEKGLSGRPSIAVDNGMLFLFDYPDVHSLWMKNMRFPIDMIWIKDNIVVDIKENVPVPKEGIAEYDLPVYTPKSIADKVLEVNAGFVKYNNIKAGDALGFY